MFARRILGQVLVALLVGAVCVAPAAAKKKQQKTGPYFGHVVASGSWQVTWPCGVFETYNGSFQLDVIYKNARLESAGQMDFSVGSANGAITWTFDRLCNGTIESGACSVGLNPEISFAPVFFDKVKGGLRVEYEPPILPVGCPSNVGTWAVAPGEVESLQRTEPGGLIPAKKIGKKTIVVPISGSGSGSSPGKSFSATMSGTLTLTRKKPLGVLHE